MSESAPSAAVPSEATAVTPGGPGETPPPRRPNLQGDLDSVLEFLPEFRSAVRGYERSQVDSYVSWAERELRATRRSADEMAARFAACSVQLERARQELARVDVARSSWHVSDRVARILELAEEEAAALTAASAAEAEELVAEAREYTAAMLRHAHEVEEVAAAGSARVALARAQANRTVEAARAEATGIRTAAAAERDRLAAEAAAERARLDRESAARRAEAEDRSRRQREQDAAAAAEAVAAARCEVEELQRKQQQADAQLRQLALRIEQSLQTLAAAAPAEQPNVVAPQPWVAGSVHAAS